MDWCLIITIVFHFRVSSCFDNMQISDEDNVDGYKKGFARRSFLNNPFQCWSFEDFAFLLSSTYAPSMARCSG